MATKGLYLRVGTLVLAGVALAVGFVLFFAAGSGRDATQVLETYSRESVQGLDVGAAVRYRGVPIGRVTEIGLVSAVYRRPEGVAYTEGFQLVLVRFGVDPAQIGDTPSLDEAIRLGLRVRITAQGLTGVNFLELDFVNPERFPAPRFPWTPRFPVIPAIPSTVAQFTSTAEQLAERLSRIPIEQMSTDLAGFLATLNRQTAGDGDVAVILRDAAAAAASLRRALDSGGVEALLAELRETVRVARTTLGGPEFAQLIANAGDAAESFRRTADAARAILDGQELRGILANAGATAQEIREAATAARNILAGPQVTELLANVSTAAEALAQTSEAARDALGGPQLRDTLANAAAAAEQLRQAAEAARGTLAGPEVRQMLASANQAASDLRRAAQRLPATVDNVDRTLRTARDTTEDVQAEIGPLLAELRAAAATLRATADALRNSPSQFLLGAPPAPERRR